MSRPDLHAPLPAEISDRYHSFLDLYARAAEGRGLAPLSPDLADTAGRVFAVSEFVARAAVADPAEFSELQSSGGLFNPRSLAEYEQMAAEAAGENREADSLLRPLRLLRRREMLRIAFRDLAGWADLTETLSELSFLADALIRAACMSLERGLREELGTPLRASGEPQSLMVVALGKLGGAELNFSSDVDLMFAFPEAGAMSEGAKAETCAGFFSVLARRLAKVLSLQTEDGIVYRVDTRLRPFGESGPMAVSLDFLEDYYETQGRDWERYALQKARLVAGNPGAEEELEEVLRPFVYRRYLDFSAFDALREMKAGIEAEVRRHGLSNDIKLSAGGIREVEFLCQALQMIRGGVLPALRERNLLSVLPVLAREGIMSRDICEQLKIAYTFLRRTENRLQEAFDTQTHRLPDGDVERAALAYSMGFESYVAFLRELGVQRAVVRGQFLALLSGGEDGDRERGTEGPGLAWTHAQDSDRAISALSEAGFPDPEKVLSLLEAFRAHAAVAKASEQASRLLGFLVPEALRNAAETEAPEAVLSLLLDLLAAVSRRVSYLLLLKENPLVLSQLARLYEQSPRISQQVLRYPMILDELRTPETLYTPPERRELSAMLDSRISSIDPDDLEEQMETLRVFKQAATFRVAAADVAGALYIMRVSDLLSDLAEIILSTALGFSYGHLLKKHGKPPCILAGKGCDTGFAVIAFGKLGGIELSYGSDLDLVFLHAGDPQGSTDGPRELDSASFFARLGQRMVHILSTHTQTGQLYDVDMRLRPSGGQGVLVSHVESFADYQKTQAWTWEHQAMVRARPVAGDPEVCRRFMEVRREVLCMVREPETLRDDVASMRERMRRELLKEQDGLFDLKQGRGGIVDIEFLVQYVVLSKAREYGRLVRWTDNVRILETIANLNLLRPSEARALNDSYLALRAAAHRLYLAGKPAVAPAAEFAEIRDRVSLVYSQVLED
ncbi:MAG: bifunctional [glutamate--ammonia ligase]-adenylyl-L-tyrosine phosphorylase/[glutamate--ammonia-ligase] adenylyltransferase [Thermodesulfobacteriota bacterium]